MIGKYRKKIKTVEAVQWTGDNHEEIDEFFDQVRWKYSISENGQISVNTAEGSINGRIGDYIIRGTKGEYYPCREDIFEDVYDVVQ